MACEACLCFLHLCCPLFHRGCTCTKCMPQLRLPSVLCSLRPGTLISYLVFAASAGTCWRPACGLWLCDKCWFECLDDSASNFYCIQQAKLSTCLQPCCSCPHMSPISRCFSWPHLVTRKLRNASLMASATPDISCTLFSGTAKVTVNKTPLSTTILVHCRFGPPRAPGSWHSTS